MAAMNQLDLQEINNYVNENIEVFHKRRIAITGSLTLGRLINKNPYLFKAKDIIYANELIAGTLDAFLSSSEEKLFGDFLEGLAIFIASKTTGGHKSTCEGMDLEFVKNGIYHVISIKSGPNWGNAAQHSRLETDFSNAEKRLRQSTHAPMIQKMLAICYGKTKTAVSNGYIKIVGQNFWTYISDNKNLYIDIVEPVGYHAREHNETYHLERARITNLLTKLFIEKYCSTNGTIDWQKLLQANSGNYDLDVFFQDEIQE
jgi:hypothetical protein